MANRNVVPVNTHPEGQANRCDVVVVGGGAAGLAAAMMLGRSRRSVVVVDAGEPRNAPAAHMHGYLGHDGASPAELLSIGRDEIRRYGVRVLERSRGEVSQLDAGRFVVHLTDGSDIHARRVLLATGLVDVLPEIEGLAEQWGRGVIACPYCHGWEVKDQKLVVIATGPGGAHQASLFRQLSEDVTVVLHDGATFDDETTDRLAARGVAILAGSVTKVDSVDGDVTGVRLGGAGTLPADAVVVGSQVVARLEAVASLGVVLVPDAMGAQIVETGPTGETSVPGLYAAGNVADSRFQVLQAAAAGAMAGAALNYDLMLEDTRVALEARSAPGAWDDRYGDEELLWSGRPNDVLLTEVGDLPPGKALDVGCGEGADAIWLASEGWDTTGVDVSRVAVDRAVAASESVGFHVEWICSDVVTATSASEGYDLVSVHYPALRHTPGDEAIHALLEAVSPGGTLLVVGHAPLDADYARSHGFEPTEYVQPADIADRLGDAWEILVNETRPRLSPPPHDSPFTHDAVLRARRRP